MNEFYKNIKCAINNSTGIHYADFSKIFTKNTIDYIEFLELSKTIHYSYQYTKNNSRKNIVYKLEYKNNYETH